MSMSEHTDLVFAALVSASENIRNIVKTHTATIQTKNSGSYQIDFAKLEDVIDGTRTALFEAGLACLQSRPESDVIVTTFVHKSGQHVEQHFHWPFSSAGGPQACGGEVTYARRYALLAALGIAATGDDDDAASAQFAASRSHSITGEKCIAAMVRRGAKYEHAVQTLEQFKADAGDKPTPGQRLDFYERCLTFTPADSDPVLQKSHEHVQSDGSGAA